MLWGALLGNRGTARHAWLAQLSPVVAEALALPGNDGPGLDECQGIAPAGPEPRQPRPEETIGRVKSRAPDSLLVDGQLMPQCQMFQAQ